MVNGFLLVFITLIFICAFFAIAWLSDRHDWITGRPKLRATIYSLSLAVYCSSWFFFGVTGNYAETGGTLIALYLGPMLGMIMGAPLIAQLARTSKGNNSRSIADFIASRYGKSQCLAVVITLISFIGILPYISLQLKAITTGYELLTAEGVSQGASAPSFFRDPALYVTLAAGLFSVLFGVKPKQTGDHHRSMIHAIAFSSIITLVVAVTAGLFLSLFLFAGWQNITPPLEIPDQLTAFFIDSISVPAFITYTLLGALAIICLPAQFHVAIVANDDSKDIDTARWIFPLCLLIMILSIIPVMITGKFPGLAKSQWLTVLVFSGGLSAVTGMVTLAVVTLGTMLSNEILRPGLLRIRTLNLLHRQNAQTWLLTLRQVAILLTLIAAYCLYRIPLIELPLLSMGLLSLAAVAQFAPSLLGGLYWRKANRQGAITGLAGGFAVWIYTLLLPTILLTSQPDSLLLKEGLASISWLKPTALFGFEGLDLVTHGTLWSLSVNVMLYLLISAITRQQVSEKIQMASFLDHLHHEEESAPPWFRETKVGDIRALAERFLGKVKAAETLQKFSAGHQTSLVAGEKASPGLIRYFEKQLARTVGSSTARAVLNSTLKDQQIQIEDVVSIVDEASQVINFNRELLQAAIENMSLGVSVVDERLNLVAWNSRLVEIFNYPQDFMHVGRPVADLLRYNLLINEVPATQAQPIVMQRIAMMQEGKAYEFERVRSDGTVILVQGRPMPDGGFVTTFSDISSMRRTELTLKETNTYLEERVKKRTEELSKLNTQLIKAKSVSELANQSKTRFLAAASHDLLQPLHAARLFTSALANKIKSHDGQQELITHINISLMAAEEILTTLLDISKLDAGVYEPQYTIFNINELLRNLNTEFGVIAADNQLELRTLFFDAYIRSDQKLLRSVIQNFMTNAIRYTAKGRILLGCRKRGETLRIEVWDTGSGIPKDQLKTIFEEFKRLNPGRKDSKGLGLGLAIVDRISRMLDCSVEVKSTPGKGSMFSISVPLADAPQESADSLSPKPARSLRNLTGIRVFCIDNEPAILEGMRALLEGWGCTVYNGLTPEQAEKICQENPPEIIIADYQLDEGKNGLDTMDMLRKNSARMIPGILVTALHSDDLKEEVRRRHYQILHKPLKPAALRAVINKVLSKA